VFLQFQTIDDACAGLHRLDGCEGPGGEALHILLLCFSMVHLTRLWGQAYVEEMRRHGEEAHFGRSVMCWLKCGIYMACNIFPNTFGTTKVCITLR
jgi:hypothetical protein